jgi:hypothetical protein
MDPRKKNEVTVFYPGQTLERGRRHTADLEDSGIYLPTEPCDRHFAWVFFFFWGGGILFFIKAYAHTFS